MASRASSWRSPPVVMASSLVLGLIFAVGHDRFYHSLDGRVVESTFQQQVVVNAGTAFAFIVKMFFVISTSTVFAQHIFLSLKRKHETIGNIDSLFDVLKNVLHLGNARLWIRHPALLLVALITWCLPIPSLFTPGTITVQPGLQYRDQVPIKPFQPQQTWFQQQDFGACTIDDTLAQKDTEAQGPYSPIICVPSGELSFVSVASASQRAILTLEPPTSNLSYTLNFHAPSLSCTALPHDDLVRFNRSWHEAGEQHSLPSIGGPYGVGRSSYLEVLFDGWIEGSYFNLTQPNWYNGSGVYEYNYAEVAETDTAKSFFFFMSKTAQETTMSLHSCVVQNSSYQVAFSYENSRQQAAVLEVGNTTNYTYNGQYYYDHPDLAGTVYWTIFQAFNSLVTGMAVNDTYEGTQTPKYSESMAQVTALRDFIEGSRPLVSEDIDKTLQDIFTNMTISTMASPALRKSDADASIISGMTWQSVNVYSYQPRNLYCAYGAALLVCLLCNIWGFFIIYQLHGRRSYSLDFSTILRTTRTRALDEAVSDMAPDGQAPAPESLQRVRLWYKRGTAANDQSGFVVVQRAKVDEASLETPNSEDKNPFILQTRGVSSGAEPSQGSRSDG